jgi:choline dehydrogenase
MLSGVGPAAHLAEHGVPVLVDAPEVGANLADHLHVPLSFAARGFYSPGADAAPEEIAQYLKDREGPLDSIFSEALVFLRTREELTAPDIEILLLLGPYGTDAAHGLSLGVVLLRPESKGTIRLHSADPRDAPLIDPAFLSDPACADLATTVAGIRKAQQLAVQAVFAKWLGEPLISGALRTDTDGIVDYIRRAGMGIHHPVSTCRMGPDPRAVVDLQFRVRGTGGLRVVDASTMPSLVRAHTHAPVTMLAERASELIVQGA